MKKTIQLIPLCVALFWACSDSPDVTGTTIIDNTMGQYSSSNEIQRPKSSSSVATSSSSQEASPAFAKDTKNGFKLGACISPDAKPLGLAKRLAQTTDIAEATFGESPKAYLLNDGNGNYQVMILNVMDYCSVDAKLSTVRSSDTLEIKYGVIKNVTECTCNNDHWFDIAPEDKTVKFIRFGGSFGEATYEVSDGPIPEPSKTTQNDSSFTDSRNGKTYKTVKLGEHIWMAENLNYEMASNFSGDFATIFINNSS